MEWTDSSPDYRSDADALLKQLEAAQAEQTGIKVFEAVPDKNLAIEDTW